MGFEGRIVKVQDATMCDIQNLITVIFFKILLLFE